jgi:Tfp pilus assembly protein PilP
MKHLLLGLLAFACIAPCAADSYDPLEKYGYHQLVLIETKISNDGRRVACFLSKTDGRVFRATIGTHLGPRNAEIKEISASSVTLVELIPVNYGAWTESKFSWPLAAIEERDSRSCADATQ